MKLSYHLILFRLFSRLTLKLNKNYMFKDKLTILIIILVSGKKYQSSNINIF